MYQIIKESGSRLVGVQFTNNVVYTTDDLKLFTNTVCVEINLKYLKQNIEGFGYEHYQTRELIQSIATGDLTFWNSTEESKKYHKNLFDVLYIKKLNELPLMINGDPDIIPVVKWRFEIGK